MAEGHSLSLRPAGGLGGPSVPNLQTLNRKSDGGQGRGGREHGIRRAEEKWKRARREPPRRGTKGAGRLQDYKPEEAKAISDQVPGLSARHERDGVLVLGWMESGQMR